MDDLEVGFSIHAIGTHGHVDLAALSRLDLLFRFIIEGDVDSLEAVDLALDRLRDDILHFLSLDGDHLHGGVLREGSARRDHQDGQPVGRSSEALGGHGIVEDGVDRHVAGDHGLSGDGIAVLIHPALEEEAFRHRRRLGQIPDRLTHRDGHTVQRDRRAGLVHVGKGDLAVIPTVHDVGRDGRHGHHFLCQSAKRHRIAHHDQRHQDREKPSLIHGTLPPSCEFAGLLL